MLGPPKTLPQLVLIGLRVFWVCLLFWYEIGTFHHSLRDCQWPDDKLLTRTEHEIGNGPRPTPTHILIVADPQILDHHSYPGRPLILKRLSQLLVDLNLRKNWRAALRTNPHAVVFLGDMMDNGRSSMTQSEYETYYRRFKSIFKMDTTVTQFYLPGNHDVGLGTSPAFSLDARERYTSHFSPLNRRVSIANHTAIFLDAVGLVEEDYKRTGYALDFKQWQATPGGPIEFIKSFADQPKESIVLFSHIPLSRPDGASCGPLREKGTIRRGIGHGYQNTLAKPVTNFLLQTIRPSIVFSGDDHDYCEYVHHISSGGAEPTAVREVTVKSFSMAMGIRRPGFQLLSLTPSPHISHEDIPCLLPDQLGIYLTVYLPLAIISILILFLSNIYRTHVFDRRTRSKSSFGHTNVKDVAEVTPSRTDNPGPRLRLDLESDNNEQRVHQYPPKDEESTGFFLPPASVAHPSHELNPRRAVSRLSWTFVFRSRRRRITIPTSYGSMVESICGWRLKRHLKRDRRGLVGGFVRDVRDVAGFPLGLFTLTAWWMFVDG